MPPSPDKTVELIGFGLFVASELIGMSKARDNSVLQLLLHMASELFPYEVKRREPPARTNRPRGLTHLFSPRARSENRR